MKSGEVVAGRYRLGARLGVGGMGEVWRATHESTHRELAIKFMHAHSAASQSARQRFTREARVSARINHPNVIDIFDAGEHGEGTLYLAMELLNGISLADALHLAPPLSVQDLLLVMHDTARALAAAHAVGVVHRDVKPANVFLHKNGASRFASAKILDFGISKFGGSEESHHTKTGAVLGSPRYMSPEQTRSAASVDHRADLWACGVILFEGFTGTWPHEGDSFSSLVIAICTQSPLSIDDMAPELPEPVRAVVRDCLKPIDQRIQTATALGDRIAAVLQDPTLAEIPLARPLHPPSESIRASTSVRIRPLPPLRGEGPQASFDAGPAGGPGLAPDSLRTTQQRGDSVLPPDGRVVAQVSGPGRPLTPEELADLPEPETTLIPPTVISAALRRGGAAALFRPLPPAPLTQPPPPPAANGTPLPTASPAAAAPSSIPPAAAFRPQMQTMRMPSGAAMHAELVRQGLVPASFGLPGTTPPPPSPRLADDPGSAPPPADLAGTLDIVATTKVRGLSTQPLPAPSIPVAPSFGAPGLAAPFHLSEPAPAPAPVPAVYPPVAPRVLRLAAAALSVLLLLIVGALVAVLRSGKP